MKVLANGGLNLSALDGWWDEAFAPDVGWAIGGGDGLPEAASDAADAEQLYAILEGDVVPAFYARDARGLPAAWVARLRSSLSCLTPRFSANRMVREYVEAMYLPATRMVRERTADGGRLGKELHAWASALASDWHTIRFGSVDARRDGSAWSFSVQVLLGDVDPRAIAVELYADARGSDDALRVPMTPAGAMAGAVNGVVYQATISSERPAGDFTPRVVPHHPGARVPAEASPILWQR
jgi:starch phosphorylase